MPWEGLDDYTERLMISKGWLVRIWNGAIGYDDSRPISMVYVPDSEYGWELEEEEE